MPKRLLLASTLLAPALAAAGDISDFDIATYSLDGKDGQPSGIEMRLSKVNGKWVMEGKEGGASPWKSISCDAGCEYRASTDSERGEYLASFPGDMPRQFDIACIQNMVNAFCRLTMKSDASKGGYALVGLVTVEPAPMSLRRLTTPYSPNTAVNTDATR
jgi:hypothetical protein